MDAGNEERVYDEAWETITANDIEPWAWGAALLGQDLRRFSLDLLQPVRSTLEELRTPFSRATEVMRPRQAPDGGERILADIQEMARAALCGLDAAAAPT